MSENDKRWRVLSSEYLIDRPWLRARKDEVQLPSGFVMYEYYVLEYPDWVNVVAITEEGDFVMERQYRHGLGKVCMEICAGVVEKGEEPLQAAKRELEEETGFGDGVWTPLMDLCANASTMNNTTHSFLAEGVKRITEPHREPSEDIDVLLMSRDEVLRHLQNNDFYQALMIAPLWKYFCTH